MKTKSILFLCLMTLITVSQGQTYLLGPQEFNSDILIHGSSAPTTVWFAPNYNTPIDYVASGGNPGGYAGYSGSWNNYWGNFVRLPQVDCGSNDTVVLSFDMSHSYFASQPNDWIRFYLWDQGGTGSYKKPVTSVKIDGVESIVDFGANGFGFRFNTPRTWVRVEVKFAMATVTDKSNVLFYIEPNCNYNNSNTFFVQFDNIGITTNPQPTAASVISHSGNRDRCVGDSVSFSVQAAGTPPLAYQWKKDGTAISGADSNILLIPSVTIDTAGMYYCVVSNGFGSDSSSAVSLAVHMTPQIAVSPSDTTICENGTATFSVSVSSTIPVWYQWMIDAVDISGATANPFIISGVTPDTAGLYRCRVANDCGATFSDQADLSVLPAPIVDLGDDTTLCVDQQITLDAGGGFVNYQWSNLESTQSTIISGGVYGPGSFVISVTVTGANLCTGGDNIQITFDPCTGITESENNALKIVPNPVSDQFTIPGLKTPCTIRIFDMGGRLHREMEIQSGIENPVITTEGLAKGSYILSISTDSSSPQNLMLNIQE